MSGSDRYSHCRAGRNVIRIAPLMLIGCFASFAVAVKADASTAWSTPDAVVQQIAKCLHDGREFVMRTGPEDPCVGRSAGASIARAGGMPFEVDIAAMCRDRNDPRALSGDVIKRLARQADLPIAPSGIRIIGAVFCGDVDLVGLELNYSLVLDYSAFSKRISGRNVRIHGDLSVESSVLRGAFALSRSHVDGSVYLNDGFMLQSAAVDTQIDGSWHQVNSITLREASFHGLKVATDFDLSGSALTKLLMTSSQIKGGLYLTGSEARCAYHIKANDIRSVAMEKTGFGSLVAPDGAGASDPTKRHIGSFWWKRLLSPVPDAGRDVAKNYASVSARLGSRSVSDLVQAELHPVSAVDPNDAPICDDMAASKNAEFQFFDNQAQSVCLRSFGWLASASGAADATTILALHGSKIASNLIIDIGALDQEQSAPEQTESSPDQKQNAPGQKKSAPDQKRSLSGPELEKRKALAKTRRFEALSVSMDTLIFNFSADEARDYVTYLDGFKFNQVRDGALDCEYQQPKPERTGLVAAGKNEATTRERIKAGVALPDVKNVEQWLQRNGASSSQPYTAFVDALDKAGGDAVHLRIAQKSRDVCEKTIPWLGSTIEWFCNQRIRSQAARDAYVETSDPRPESAADDADNRAAAESARAVVRGSTDVLVLAYQWALWGLADHGFRPSKALLATLLVLGAFWLWFWFKLRIVGFEPKSEEKSKEHPAQERSVAVPDIWPIGPLFLFDRLIPVYRIRDEHYSIARYFRAAHADEKPARHHPGKPPYPMVFFRRNWFVCPVGDEEKARAEKWLVVLRVIGAVLSVFLLAAVNALIRS
jgi:hypothetical protein